MKFMPFDELGKARLAKEFSDKGRDLNAGLIGKSFYCPGDLAYEVEFQGIHDMFQIQSQYLEKTVV